MTFTEKFILFWMLLLLVLAFGSWANEQRNKRRQPETPPMPSLDDIWAEIFPLDTPPSKRVESVLCETLAKNNRYYHDL